MVLYPFSLSLLCPALNTQSTTPCGDHVDMAGPTLNRATSNERPHECTQQCTHGDLIGNVTSSSADVVVGGSYGFRIKD